MCFIHVMILINKRLHSFLKGHGNGFQCLPNTYICTYMPDGTVECVQAAPFSLSIRCIMWCNVKLRLSGVCVSGRFTESFINLICIRQYKRKSKRLYVVYTYTVLRKRTRNSSAILVILIVGKCLQIYDLKWLVFVRSCRQTKTSRETSLSAAATASSGTRWEE